MKLPIRILNGKIITFDLFWRLKCASIIQKAVWAFQYGRPGVDYYT